MVWRAAPESNGDGIAEAVAYGAAYGDTYGDDSLWDGSPADDASWEGDSWSIASRDSVRGVSAREIMTASGRHARPATASDAPGPASAPTDSPAAERDERRASAAFRAVMGNFATGVTVITTLDGQTPVGFTCQAFTSLSLDPPLISFAVSRQSASRARILSTGRFCVNILAYDQRGLCAKFAASGVDRFQGTPWRLSPHGSPAIDGSIGWIDCSVEAEYPAGDHTIVLGRVHDLAITREAAPLVFHRGEFANCFATPGGDSLSRAS